MESKGVLVMFLTCQDYLLKRVCIIILYFLHIYKIRLIGI